MVRARRLLLLAAGLAGLAAPPAAAVPLAPGASWHDRVLSRSARIIRAQASAAAVSGTFTTPDGHRIRVAFSPTYGYQPALARSYVNFLGSLPHGSELGRLALYIAPPSEVSTVCGGDATTLACYETDSHVMTVPGEQSGSFAGVSTDFVIAHEYGHHLASFRSDDPFAAIDFGPKYWSSDERICAGALAHDYYPGNEAGLYAENPGEAWAETYAHLTFSDQPWPFVASLAPTPASLAAARRDVLRPWRRAETRAFSGSLSAHHRSALFRVHVRLDGRLSAVLSGPRHASFDLRLAGGSTHLESHAPGSHDALRVTAACRERPIETLSVRVLRRTGTGPFRLRVGYAG